MIARRLSPRIPAEALCSEIINGRERHALVADLSPEGIRISRPFIGGPTPRLVQLEFELPGIDEIIWAAGEICFDRIEPGPPGRGVLRTSGLRLLRAAARDLRLLREYVFDVWQPLPSASCYARG